LQRTFARAVGFEDAAHTGSVPREGLAEHYAALQHRAEELMRGKTTEEWKEVFNAHGVPASGVKFPIELLDDPQVTANGMVYDVPHPSLGTVRVLSNPVELDEDGFRAGGATPAFGSESVALLTELGFSEGDIALFLREGHNHDGLVEA
jgi:crotonobetainyl-CoA:carnitine CoA-transferase CaiB-like acyl-CoA transferase